jgi:hypothetical protein
MTKMRADWAPNMKRPAADLEVRCLTNDEGHVWMHYYDRLPLAVRHRLAESRFNICAACLTIEAEAHTAASKRGQRKPTVAVYLEVIEAIERKLMREEKCQ